MTETWNLKNILFSRSFWAFFGSGLIVSVAYMDPGNWGTSISAGASYNYALLWAIWFSSGAAMLFQYISGKLGIAGHTIGDLVRKRWKNKKLVLTYWIFAEIAILATDLAEFLGIVVALNLLFGMPYMIGVFVAAADVLLLMYFTEKKFRILEYMFILFVGIIGAGYVYELFITKPVISDIVSASFHPSLNVSTALLVVGIIGATVMPHALFVHSWLMKKKMHSKEAKKLGKKTILKFHLTEIIIALVIATLVNAAILIMSAAAFHANGVQIATIDEAYHTLTPLFGTFASLAFGIALLSSGISSSITGTLSGQSIMDTMTDFRLSLVTRRIITRVLIIIPVLIAFYLEIEPLKILVFSQVILSIMIPLPLIPLIYYSTKKEIMGSLVNKKITTITAGILALIIICFNIYLLYTTFF